MYAHGQWFESNVRQPGGDAVDAVVTAVVSGPNSEDEGHTSVVVLDVEEPLRGKSPVERTVRAIDLWLASR